MKRSFILLFILGLLSVIGCDPAQTARDAIATATGAIAKAQADNQVKCEVQPAQAACVLINRAVNAQNAAITALETYCGWQLSGTLPSKDAKCSEHPDNKAQLDAALRNLNQLVSEVKGAAK